MFDIRPKTKAAWNLLSLDEILLRFNSENERLHNARSFRVFDDGAEHNVAQNLK